METSVKDNTCKDFCDCLLHPFQNDAGVSQQQRVMDELLGGKTKIDARKTADLLDYIYQLSGNINFYNTDLAISDWKPFFDASPPFALASLIRYNLKQTNERFELYKSLFEKKQTVSGLQLILFFIFYNTVKRVNNWYKKIKGTGLPAERIFESIIKDKLKEPLQNLIALNQLASKWFCVSKFDLAAFFQDDIWEINTQGSLSIQAEKEENDILLNGDCDRLRDLYNRSIRLYSSLAEPIMILATAAELSLEQSIFPLKQELQKKHLPHLGLLFAFIKLFEKLQNNLNEYTKKHIDFFYKDVLKLKPKKEVPDQAYIVFEIQKELDKYLLKEGLLVKDGKDINKEEVLFSLDDDIVVNQAQVKDVRTLHLNNQVRPDPAGSGNNISITEGVYIASDARMADGIDKDFQSEVKNFYTVGNKESKYVYPGRKVFKPYPNARLGFILASPVLLLSGGKRTVNVTLACQLEDPTDDHDVIGQVCKDGADNGEYAKNYPARQLFSRVRKAFRKYYVYISEELIQEAAKKGISPDTVNLLRNKFLLESNRNVCGVFQSFYKNENSVDWEEWRAGYYKNVVTTEKDVIDELFKRQRVFKILFSGEKEWIEPDQLAKLRMTSLTEDPVSHKKTFSIKFTAIIKDGRPGVTFFNKETLKEDFDSTQPLMKIELNDKIKVKRGFDLLKNGCCLDKKYTNTKIPISFYYFLRNVRIIERTNKDLFTRSYETRINVKVCGLKNFIVQNDDGVMDVNGPIYPFGPRPDIIDFNVINPSYCLTPSLIDDAIALNPGGFRNEASRTLRALLTIENNNRIRIAKTALSNFLGQSFTDPVTHGALFLNVAEKSSLVTCFTNNSKNYCGENLKGPNFYIGSKEVFCKKWNEVFVKFNWKDRPSDFRDYYKGYIAKADPSEAATFIYGMDKNQFQINLSILKNGKWNLEDLHSHAFPLPDDTNLNEKTNCNNRLLFPDYNLISFCASSADFETLHIKKSFFSHIVPEFQIDNSSFGKFDVGSRKGFLRINLQNQDFLHKNYPYVLARQMMALGKLPTKIDDAVYYDKNGGVIVFNATEIRDSIAAASVIAEKVQHGVNDTPNGIKANAGDPGAGIIDEDKAEAIRRVILPPTSLHLGPPSVPEIDDGQNMTKDVDDLAELIGRIGDSLDDSQLQAIIPNTPWTPAIENISIDYKATATIKDIDLIHLYPFANTYKHEEMELQPTLFPAFCDEGTLFIGLEKLVPGNNLNILFQLAEATADSESDPENVHWHYLDNNTWKPLREGFEVLKDDTEDLTTSGIIKFATPENMTNKNTVMPSGLHWIKATIPKNSGSVSETTGIHTQAMSVTFTNTEANDKLRLAKPIDAKQIAKLNEADASVKQVIQPYETFGGQVPENEGMFYVRVSELLRHKGRAIQKFDYERILLDQFPQIFKTKCINHSFGLNAHLYKNDFPYAPGYVVLAVIPDLFKLKAGNAFEPKVPVSLLEKIDDYMRKHTSVFVKFRAMNPRYEKVHLSIKVKLIKGKDEIYFKERLGNDIREFLAPWAVGEYYKLSFGQCVNRSDIIRFMETRDYIDFILELRMRHETEEGFPIDKTTGAIIEITEVCPQTPRSILLAGDVDVCIEKETCGNWDGSEKCVYEKNKPGELL